MGKEEAWKIVPGGPREGTTDSCGHRTALEGEKINLVSVCFLEFLFF